MNPFSMTVLLFIQSGFTGGIVRWLRLCRTRQTDPDYCALAMVLEVRSRSHLNPLTSIACQRQYNLGQEYDIPSYRILGSLASNGVLYLKAVHVSNTYTADSHGPFLE